MQKSIVGGVRHPRAGVDADTVDAALERGVTIVVTGVSVGVHIGHIGGDNPVDIVIRLVAQRNASTQGVVIVVVMAGRLVKSVAVVPGNGERGGAADLIRDRPVHERAAIGAVVIPVGAAEFVKELVGWLARDDLHHTAECVFAEQRPLRPAKNFNPFQIVEIQIRTATGEIGAIQHQDNGRVTACVSGHPDGCSNAADVVFRFGLVIGRGCEIWGALGNVCDTVDRIHPQLL